MKQVEHELAPPSHDAGGEGYADASLAQDLRLLAGEAKALAQAEFAFQKSRAAYVGAETRTIALLLVVAAVVVFFAVMALVVGTVIALGPLLGAWGAMAVVTLALIVVAALCALNAKSRIKRMMTIAGGDTET
jgi:hypothetical protein